MQQTQVQSLGWDSPLGDGLATHSSILAWRIPWTEELSGLQSIGLQRAGHDWSDWAQNDKKDRISVSFPSFLMIFQFQKILSLQFWTIRLCPWKLTELQAKLDPIYTSVVSRNYRKRTSSVWIGCSIQRNEPGRVKWLHKCLIMP